MDTMNRLARRLLHTHTLRDRVWRCDWLLKIAPLLVLLGSLSQSVHGQACANPQPTIRFVYTGIGDDTGHSGQCWEQAFATLDRALLDLHNEQLVPPVTTILIAQGTYTPSSTSGFEIGRAVRIEGGYRGFTDGGGSAGDRNLALYPTRLDGQGTRRVVSVFILDEESEEVAFDGLILENGLASGSEGGGGMRIQSPVAELDALFVECTFEDNEAGVDGGALWIDSSRLTLRNCHFVNNAAVEPPMGAFVTRGGAIYGEGPLTAVLCTFVGNSTEKSQGGGGAIFAGFRPGDDFRLTLCEFRGNSAGPPGSETPLAVSGGAVCIADDCEELPECSDCADPENDTCAHSMLEATGCLFVENTSHGSGGAIGGNIPASSGDAATQRGGAVLRQCTFAENAAMGDGCAVACRIVDAGNSIVYFNRELPSDPKEDPPYPVCSEQLLANDGDLTIAYSCVQDLDLGQFGDGNINDNPRFRGASDPDCPYCPHHCSAVVNSGSAALIPDDVTDRTSEQSR